MCSNKDDNELLTVPWIERLDWYMLVVPAHGIACGILLNSHGTHSPAFRDAVVWNDCIHHKLSHCKTNQKTIMNSRNLLFSSVFAFTRSSVSPRTYDHCKYAISFPFYAISAVVQSIMVPKSVWNCNEREMIDLPFIFVVDLLTS